MSRHTSSNRPMSLKASDRRPPPYSQNENQMNENAKLRSQIEIEKKARREAEEKYKQVVAKLDVLQQRLLDKNKEIEEERAAKEEALKSNQTLEMTINKMEEYLRKKNTRFDTVNIDPDGGKKPAIENIIKTETELEEKSKQLAKEKQANDILDKRCNLLEKLLRENNISVDNSEMDKLNAEITNNELDF